MRTRDPRHEEQLDDLAGLGFGPLIERIKVRDHNDAQHIHSEVLATLIRRRAGQPESVVTAAVEELNARIQMLVGKRWSGVSSLPGVRRRGSNAMADTIDYVWDRIFEDPDVSNCEVRFAVFVRDRVDEYLRHLETDKNSMDPIETMSVVDLRSGAETPLLDLIEGAESERPEVALMDKQRSKQLQAAVLALSARQRQAWILRADFEYEWQHVANCLGCSVPVARELYGRARAALKGALA